MNSPQQYHLDLDMIDVSVGEMKPTSEQNSPSGYSGAKSPQESQRAFRRSETPAGNAKVRQIISLTDLQLNLVRVFTDRAELCRQMTTDFRAGEIVELLFDAVSSAIEEDSIRVELRGASTILDVNYNARASPELEEAWLRSGSRLRKELISCQRQEEVLMNKIQRLEKQHQMLEAFADNLSKPKQDSREPYNQTYSSHQLLSVSKKNKVAVNSASGIDCKRSLSPEMNRFDSEMNTNTSNPFDPAYLDTIERFFNVYDEQAERLVPALSSAKEELCYAQRRIDEIMRELEELEKHKDDNMVREISVLIEPREDGPVDIFLTYVATRCSWKPAYDIRLFNNDGSMKIIYYGIVRQATGEEWKCRRMTLSTAKPSYTGLPSTLGRLRLYYKQSSPLLTSKSQSRNAIVSRSPPALKRTGSPKSTTESVHHPMNISDIRRNLKDAGTQPNLETSRQQLNHSMLNCNIPLSDTEMKPNSTVHSDISQDQQATVLFEVPRPPFLVPSNNEDVRVTIGLIDLHPNYSYVTVPKCSLSVFLKATAVNHSHFCILPGQTNIYSDNTFVGKSRISSVATGDEFSCDLGAETGIDVGYRPIYKSKDVASSNKQKVSLNCKQQIDIRNNFPRPVRITVVDQIPCSGEEKIKVTLVEPFIKNPEKYDKTKSVRMNKYNNVEWDIDLNPGETKELSLRYSVEYPTSEELEVRVL